MQWLLFLLGAAGALFALSRTRAGVSIAIGDSLEFIDVSASRIKNALVARGYRNNNPGNIRFIVRDPWNGQSGDDNGYGIYVSPQLGTRALGKELLKRKNQGFRTVRDLIAGKLANGRRSGGWAPPNENNTEAYIADVCSQLNVTDVQPLDIDARLVDLAIAIARHENGYLDSAYNWLWVRLP